MRHLPVIDAVHIVEDLDMGTLGGDPADTGEGGTEVNTDDDLVGARRGVGRHSPVGWRRGDVAAANDHVVMRRRGGGGEVVAEVSGPMEVC